MSRSRIKRSIGRHLAVIAALLFVAPGGEAAKTCFDCHKKQRQEFLSKKSVHDPVKAENCESCHKRHGFAQRLVLVANDNELCFGCHSDLKEKFSSGSVHIPVSKGYCWDCHDPHASDKKALLRSGPEGMDDPASCLMCHNPSLEPDLQAARQHQPFAKLQCLSCHQPHNSAQPGLLSQNSPTLCLSCHQKDQERMEKAHESKHTEALSCIDCHSGHASVEKGLLSDKTHPPFAEGDCETCHTLPNQSGQVDFAEGSTKNSICAECHHEQAKSKSWRWPHPAVTDDDCSDCHGPHSSRFAKLLIKEQGEICEDCHTDVLTVSDLGKHQPVLLGQCDKCHDIHG